MSDNGQTASSSASDPSSARQYVHGGEKVCHERELCRELGDAVIRRRSAAGVLMTSTPSVNVTPWMTLGNWFSPFSWRQVLAAAMTSLNTISRAVSCDSAPLVRMSCTGVVAWICQKIE